MGENSKLTIIVPVKNIDETSGAEIVQLYIKDVKSRLLRLEKEIKVFDNLFF